MVSFKTCKRSRVSTPIRTAVWIFKFSESLKGGNAYVMAVHGSLAKLGNELSLQRDQSRRNHGDCLPRTEAWADAILQTDRQFERSVHAFSLRDHLLRTRCKTANGKIQTEAQPDGA
jgi:hypothetical protein